MFFALERRKGAFYKSKSYFDISKNGDPFLKKQLRSNLFPSLNPIAIK
jgi:hypothetical protein